MHRPWLKALSLVTILALVLMALPLQSANAATPTDLFFSEYIEGSSNNKALEIYNGTGAAVDLAAGGYNVQQYSNGSASAGLTINLVGTVASSDVFVLAHSSAAAAILAQADQTSGAGLYNGNDALVLRKGTTVLDVIGQIGVDPGTEWGTGVASTQDNTLRRKAAICAGDPIGSDAFDPTVEWDGFANNTFDGLGAHTASCGATTILSLTINDVSANEGNTGSTNFTFTVSLSLPAGAGGVTFDITTADNTATAGIDYVAVPWAGRTIPAGGQTHSFTVQVYGDTTAEPDETFFVNVTNVAGAIVTDNQGQGTIVNDDPVITPIPAIQGSGPVAAIIGSVTTVGVVVGDHEGPSPALRGFYLQDPTGDGDPATSDGIFVFNGNNNSVNLGDVVQVTGTAAEFQEQTQISASSVVIQGQGSVAPVDVTLPFASATALEQYEGMLVRLPQTLYVTEHFQLGRFGQVVLSSVGRLMQPTNIYAPLSAEAIALQAANNLNRIILDDASQAQNPDPIVFARGGQPLSASNTLRGGDTATGIVGVMTYTWAGNSASGNAYRVRPINALGGYVNFEAANPRPEAAPEPSGSLRVAGMNLLNYFNTFDGLPDKVDNCTLGVGGAPTDCRGADTQAEFDRQGPKTVAAILGTQADVIGLVEVENDGYGPESALQVLVDQLNTSTAPGTYAFIDADAGTGQVNALGTDAIKVGLIYKPARVTPVGTTAALNTVEFVNGGDNEPRNRPVLAQAFQENITGGRLVVAVNHLKSKGSACDAPDTGDGQGNCNAVRTYSANVLGQWLAADPTGTGDPDALIIGDLNSYAQEDPITALKTIGYTDLKLYFGSWEAYSYVFDGQWGYLDHALSSHTLTPQVLSVTDWHINADEPSVLDYNMDFKSAGQIGSLYAPDWFRIADHDPVLVDLDVCDEIAPTLELSVTPNVLWPANHKYVDVMATVAASDNFDPNPTITLVSVTSNEPDEGLGDGDTPIDIVIVDDFHFQLRAERAGTGMDRVYTITYRVTDACGNSTEQSVTVTVPHDKGK